MYCLETRSSSSGRQFQQVQLGYNVKVNLTELHFLSRVYQTSRHIFYCTCTCYSCLPEDEPSCSRHVLVEGKGKMIALQARCGPEAG